MLSGRNYFFHLADEKTETQKTDQKHDSHLDFYLNTANRAQKNLTFTLQHPL